MSNSNLEFQGNFEIKIVREDGSIRDVINKDNNITYSYYREHQYSNSGNINSNIIPPLGYSNLHISISGNTIDQGRELSTLNKIYATGSPNVTLGNKLNIIYATSSNLVGVLEIRERIDFTASVYGQAAYSRQFNTIALTTDLDTNADYTKLSSTTYSYPTSNVISKCMAYIVLGSPCTQASNEFLDVTYRLQIKGNNEIIINDYLNGLVQTPVSYTNNTYQNKDRNFYTIVNTSTTNYYKYYSGTFFPVYNNFSDTNFWLSTPDALVDVYSLTGSKKTKYRYSVPSNTLRGKVVRGILFGIQRDLNPNNIRFSKGLLNLSSTRFQSIFSHNINANTPYYDLNNLASGSIKPALSGTWDKNIPELYLLNVKTTGTIGTSTYTYSKRKFIGSNGLSWDNDSIYSPYIHQSLSPFKALYPGYPNKTLSTTTDHEIQRLRYSQVEIVQADIEKVALINVFTGDYKLWNSNTTPSLPTTKIKQLCIVGNLIYIACANTGLWVINITANTITNLNSTPCLSVDNSPLRVIALFNVSNVLKLSRSDDSFTTYDSTFNFPLSNLFNSSLDYFYFHKLDKNPNATSDRLCLVSSLSGSDFNITWWDSSTGTLVNGPGFNPLSVKVNPQVIVSTNNGGWVGGFPYVDVNGGHVVLVTFFFNTTTTNNTDNLGSPSPNLLVLEDNSAVITNRGVVTISIDTNNPASKIIQTISKTIGYYTDPDIVYLGKGLALASNKVDIVLNNFITTNGNYADINTSNRLLNPYIWDTYYWNSGSSSWVLDNATWNGTNWVTGIGTGKPSHTTTDILNTDVSISFTELASAGLVAGDYYTQIICNGVSLDSITNDFEYRYYWNYLPIEKNTIGSNFNIPSSAPYMKLVPKSVYESSNTRDATWGWLETEDTNQHTINIVGYSNPAGIITDPTITPGPNEILINGSNGNLIFNVADAGKVISPSSIYQISNKHKIITNLTVTPFAGVHRPVCLLRSDTGLTLNNGVETWADQSGYSNNATKLTGTKPTTGLKGSVTTVNFGTNSSYMKIPNIGFFADGFSTFIYFKYTTPNTDKVFFTADSNVETERGHFYYYISSNNKLVFGFLSESNQRQTFSSDVLLTDNTWYLISITNRPDFKYTQLNNGMIIRINQVNSTFTVGGNNIAAIPIKHFADNNIIGGYTANINASFIGEIGFFSFYRNYLTLPEIQLVENGILSIFP